ncbi:hypothetical protein F7725_003159 [Dissostichus mawsoni]|uniref:Uncharacterized protein n=1 Tax=Dissostichus mawsoni TaxID=36200 RepID=A0A7J5YAT2_DISMA|nr:hypothetical protein F7725_003159 [Dissostichus mawsoni]
MEDKQDIKPSLSSMLGPVCLRLLPAGTATTCPPLPEQFSDHLVYQFNQLVNLNSISPVFIVQDVISVPAHLDQPLQRLSFALNALLDTRVAQPVTVAEQNCRSAPHLASSGLQLFLYCSHDVIPVVASLHEPLQGLPLAFDALLRGRASQPVPESEQHDDTAPDVLADQLEVLLSRPPVGLSEGSVHTDHQQEDVRPRRAERQAEQQLPPVEDGTLVTIVVPPPARSVHHRHLSPKHRSSSHHALGCSPCWVVDLTVQDCVQS